MNNPQFRPGFTRLGLLSAVSLLAFSCTSGPRHPLPLPTGSGFHRPSEVSRLKAYLESERQSRGIVGMGVAVVDRKGLLLAEGFGLADRDSGRVARGSTPFPLGSVSKTFTALAAVLLAEEGKLDLDSPVDHLVPELRLPGGEEKTITPRMLLTHHSGLQGDILRDWFLPEVLPDPRAYEGMIPLLNQAGTVTVPGRMFSYSNAGYGLLGAVLDRASGRPWPELIRSRILVPLEMGASLTYAGEGGREKVALGYSGGSPRTMPVMRAFPAGGLAVSPEDGAVYLQELLQAYRGESRVFSSTAVRALLTPQNSGVLLDRGFRIGLAWFLQDPLGTGSLSAFHKGELPPFHAMIHLLPEEGLGILVMVNTQEAAAAPEELSRDILRYLWSSFTGKTPLLPRPAPEGPAAGEVLNSPPVEGKYSTLYFGAAEVRREGQDLLLLSPALPMPMALIPRTDGSYRLKPRLLGFWDLEMKELEDLSVEFRRAENRTWLTFRLPEGMVNPNAPLPPEEEPWDLGSWTGSYKPLSSLSPAEKMTQERIVKDVRIERPSSGSPVQLSYTFLETYKFVIALRAEGPDKARMSGEGYFNGERLWWESREGKVYLRWSGLTLERQ